MKDKNDSDHCISFQKDSKGPLETIKIVMQSWTAGIKTICTSWHLVINFE